VIEPLLNKKTKIKEALIPVKPKFNTSELLNEFSIPEKVKKVLMLPGSGWATKQWPAENFIETGKKLETGEWKVILAGSEKEKPLCEKISAELTSSKSL